MIESRTKYEIIISLALLILCIFFYQRWDTKSRELELQIKGQQTEKIIQDINKTLGEITQRENELYPKIDANIKTINNNIKKINDNVSILEKNRPTKEESNEKFKNKTVKELSDYFTNNGYPNTIISK